MAVESKTIVPKWMNGDDFVKHCLKGVDDFHDFDIVFSSIQNATAGGDNYLSDTYRLNVVLKHLSQYYTARLSLFIKCLPEGQTVREVARKMRAFERETCIFVKTLPSMNRLLRSGNPVKFSQLCAACYSSGRQPVDYLVLEDLRESGFVMAKRSCGLDLPHCKTVMRKLAELHAASIALHLEDPSCMDNYRTYTIFNGEAAPQFENFLKQACLFLATELENSCDSYSRYASKIRAIAGKVFTDIAELTKWKKRKFQALIHADSWINNMMFKYSADGVKDVVFLDFQMSHFSSPSIDLQYFIHTSLAEQVYARHLETLLNVYHSHLIETLSDIGVDKENQISYDDFRQDFDDHVLFSLYGAIAVQPLVRSDEKTGFDIEASIMGNESRINREAFANESFKKCIRQMLPEFERRGLL